MGISFLQAIGETIGRYRYISSIFDTPGLNSEARASMIASGVSVQAAVESNPRYATYYRHLSLAGHGTPLWLPEPNNNHHINYRRRGAAIGDVVLFTKNGGLHFLFNICLDAHDPINSNNVPEGFSPFTPVLRPSDTYRVDEYGDGEYLASKSITKKRDLYGPAGLWFTSSASEGAILTLPEGAYSDDLVRESTFDRYLADNLDSWYTYVNEVRKWGVEQGELHVITGVHKAKAWGIATFSNETTVATDLRMIFKSNQSTSSGDPYSWEYEGIVDSTRSGPTRRQRDAIFEGLEEAERQPFENQCLFVRTANGMIRKPEKLKDRESNSVIVPSSGAKINPDLERSSTARPNRFSSLWGGSNEPRGRSGVNQLGTQSNLSIVQIGPVLREHPLKAINCFLLKEKPNARIVITHDQDWISLLTKDDISLPSGDELVARLKKSYKIIEDDGIVSLESASENLYKASERGYEAAVKTLLQRGVNVNEQGGEYGNALQMASFWGHEAVARLLLQKGADINIQGGKYGNALQAASARGHKAVSKLLVENGARVNAQGGLYGNALQAASAEGYDAIAKLLVANGAYINAQGGLYGNALQAASFYGKDAVAKLLLDNGADINAQGGRHGNALQAASTGGYEAAAKLLLENGADINAQGGPYGNALHAASARGHEAVVKLLIENEADVNAQGGPYSNALHAASARGHEAVAKLLLDNGADINAQGGLYGTTLQAASFWGSEAVAKLLLENGANVNAQGGPHGRALYAASARGHKAVVKLLLESGADINAQGGLYGNALQAASAEGYEEVVKLLVEKGADVTAKGGRYSTALQAARAEGHKEVIKLLLDNGADVNAQRRQHDNVLHAASRSGYENCESIPEELGG